MLKTKKMPAGGLRGLAAGGHETSALDAPGFHLHSITRPPVCQGPITTICLPDGRKVGEVVGDCLVKRARGSVHMLQKPRAWAVDVSVLRQAERLGARTVEVHDLETDIVYHAELSHFWSRGVPIDRGFGQQIALPLSCWQTGDAPAADAVQLPLLPGLEEVGR